MSLPIELPAVPLHSERPVWTGKGFQIGQKLEPVLCYDVASSGWTDGLTDFHEETAGETHYMDVASHRNALARARKWITKPNPVIMDIGCSSGFMLRELKSEFPQAQVIGADYVVGPLRKLAGQHPDWPLLQFDLTTCPLPDECLDATTLLNVLEHIPDDRAAVRQLYRLTRKGGVAIVEVPAGPHLFDVYDKQLMHHRRYKLDGLRDLLAGAGFEVADASHIGFLLYAPFAYTKRKNRKYLSLPDEEQLRIVQGSIRFGRSNRILHGVMALEEAIRYKVPLPVGIRCVAVGVKR